MPFLEWLILKWSFLIAVHWFVFQNRYYLLSMAPVSKTVLCLLLAFGWGRKLREEAELTTGLMWRERHDSSTEFLCFGERAEVAGKRRPGTFEEWRHSSLVTFHCRKMQTCSFLSFSLPLVLNFSLCFSFFFLSLSSLSSLLFRFLSLCIFSLSLFNCVDFSISLPLFFLLPYFPFHTAI